MKPVNWNEVMRLRPDLQCEGLSPEQEQQLRQLLLLMPIGGRLSLPVFLWSRATFVSPAVEVVFYRRVTGRTEVLLKRRPAKKDDPVYSGKLGVIGKVETPNHGVPNDSDYMAENSFDFVFRGALAEIGLEEKDLPTRPRPVDQRLFDGDRGWVHQTLCVWFVPPDVEIKGVEWHDPRNLPQDVIEEHRSLIALAAQCF